MVLQIPFPATPVFSHLYTTGGVFRFVDGICAHAFPNQEPSRRSSAFSAPACCRQACPPPGGAQPYLVILRIFRAVQTFQLSTVDCQPPLFFRVFRAVQTFQLSTVNRPYSFASSEPFKPFDFQL